MSLMRIFCPATLVSSSLPDVIRPCAPLGERLSAVVPLGDHPVHSSTHYRAKKNVGDRRQRSKDLIRCRSGNPIRCRCSSVMELSPVHAVGRVALPLIPRFVFTHESASGMCTEPALRMEREWILHFLPVDTVVLVDAVLLGRTG
ncbi:hypothetical protein RHCRD62_120055 [Rhodococcus sp. RD6.2]|nr:hypothetical protein RHCRD62_120055 [Rhodococcus sp. RD6.2]